MPSCLAPGPHLLLPQQSRPPLGRPRLGIFDTCPACGAPKPLSFRGERKLRQRYLGPSTGQVAGAPMMMPPLFRHEDTRPAARKRGSIAFQGVDFNSSSEAIVIPIAIAFSSLRQGGKSSWVVLDGLGFP